MTFKSKYTTRDQSALNEATDRPIFLFQAKRWYLTAIPDDYTVDDEGDVVKANEDGEPLINEDGELAEVLSWEQLEKTYAISGGYDIPCAMSYWETCYVFLTREEAEEFGRARHYNYRDGWRVYSVCAKGELREALVDGTEYSNKKLDSTT